MHRFRLSWIALASGLLLAAHANAVEYGITADLGGLPGFDLGAGGFGITDSGFVVGQAYATAGTNGNFNAFTWTSGTGMVNMDPPLTGASGAFGVSPSGTYVVGQSFFSGAPQAFVYNTTDTSVTNPGALSYPNSSAEGVNNSGTVVGFAYNAIISDQFGSGVAFKWTSGGGIVSLGTLGGAYSSAIAINNNGDIAGTSNTVSGDQHAFIIPNGGSMTDIGTLGGSVAVPKVITDSGVVLGYSDTATAGITHAFMWTSGGGMVDLGNLGGTFSGAYGMDAAGDIIGDAYDSSGNDRAFIILHGTSTMLDLNSLLDPADSGYTIEDALAITSTGEILAYGSNPLGQNDPFLLDVIPEPESLLLFVFAAVLLVPFARLRMSQRQLKPVLLREDRPKTRSRRS